jgi:Xaa-Pro dipeptidase
MEAPMLQKELSFSVDEYQSRLAKVQARMREAEADVFLSHIPENLFYLSGYRTPGYYRYQCIVVGLDRGPLMVTRRFEQYNVNVYSWFDDSVAYLDTEDYVDLTARAIEDFGAGSRTIGVEKDSWFLTIQDFERLQQRLPNARFVDLSGTVEAGRLIKSPAEVEYMRKAARAAEVGMRAGIDAVKEGTDENQIAAAVWNGLVLNGSEVAGLPPFIVSGPRTLIPHASWAGRKIEKGDPVLFEIAGVSHRYAAAFSRMASLGKPSAEIRKIGDAVAFCLEQTIAGLRPGMSADQVNTLAQDALAEKGFPGVQSHRIAYSIGINYPPDWGEGHIMSIQKGEKRLLQPGMTFHIIPTLFVSGVAAIICTETILVTESGAESIFNFERRFFEQ